jgi:hypothetical protein
MAGGPRFCRDRLREMRSLDSVCAITASCVRSSSKLAVRVGDPTLSWCTVAGSVGANGQCSMGALNAGFELPSAPACICIESMQWCFPFFRQHARRFDSPVEVAAKSGAANGNPRTASKRMDSNCRNSLIETPTGPDRNRLVRPRPYPTSNLGETG